MAQDNKKGGLGRGLAALIPTSGGPTSPHLGDKAADVILGGTKSTRRHPVLGAQPKSPDDPELSASTSSTASRVPTSEGMGEGTGESTDMGATYREIPLGRIVANHAQPRQVFDPEQLEELVHSIREFGLMQPIVVREDPQQDGHFELIMGERRWRAAAKAGLVTIPAIVRATEDGAMLRDALLENIHRVQLNPLEEAAAYQQLLEEFGVTQAELAQRLGRSRPVITNMIRLLALPVPVQRRVAAGVLSAGHARALLGLKLATEAETTVARESLAERIVAEGLSVRATEEAVTLLNAAGVAPSKRTKEPVPQPAALTHAAERLADEWDTKVTVQMGRKKGKMIVEFGDQEDFERILALIEGKG